MKYITYEELKAYMRANNNRRRPKKISAVVCVKPGCIYIVNNDNPIFREEGKELFATSMDESEICIRLDLKIKKNNIDYCYIIGEKK